MSGRLGDTTDSGTDIEDWYKIDVPSDCDMVISCDFESSLNVDYISVIALNEDGGTFDAALLKVEDGIMQVFDTEGDNYLGGKNLDYAIVDDILVPYIQENFEVSVIMSNENKRTIIREVLKDYAEKAREIIKTVGAEKAANLNPVMIENIAKGRLQKFLKENTLVEQEYQMSDDKKTVKEVLEAFDKDVKVIVTKRFSLTD